MMKMKRLKIFRKKREREGRVALNSERVNPEQREECGAARSLPALYPAARAAQ